MISLSVLVGRIFSPTNYLVARLRDTLTFVLSAFPAVKEYILQMKFKPMPFYQAGAVVHTSRTGKMKAKSAVGRMFPQPWVVDAQGRTCRLDEVLGDWFSIVSYAVDPTRHMAANVRNDWERMGARLVCIAPESQLESLRRIHNDGNAVVVSERGQDLKQWFGLHQVATVIVRPDRFVAAAGEVADIDMMSCEFKTAIAARLHAKELGPPPHRQPRGSSA
jgi:3-(3-hydroxy-phenyl)propionate hydroxylase